MDIELMLSQCLLKFSDGGFTAGRFLALVILLLPHMQRLYCLDHFGQLCFSKPSWAKSL